MRPRPMPTYSCCGGTRKMARLKLAGLPPLPRPCAHGQAALIGNSVYLAGGQSGAELSTALSNFWQLDLSRYGEPDLQWKELPPCPGPPRSLNLTVAQHNGFVDCIYVLSGRREGPGGPEFLTDAWEFNPSTQTWRQRANLPQCVMAGTAIGYGQSHVLVLGGDDGKLFTQSDELRDAHPGFPKQAFAYHTITDTWTSAGTIPENHVTTQAVNFNGQIVVPSGEVRPRVRSPKVWSITLQKQQHTFGWVNYLVLFGYLTTMVMIGVYFTRKNKSTDDFFRGGKEIPWWAAGCSIFATMLSSLTFTGVPSKAFAQDWVYAVGNFMIPVVAFIAVFVALPFYRRIDATSAYEYLELRFNRVVRLFGSLSFSVFHLFRMAVVMSLTGLALAIATPLTPSQSVLIMGLLSIIYCTLGGIEAVIWTDTIQTFVLLGGALIALVLLISGVDGGWSAFFSQAGKAGKFTWAHHNLDVTSAQMALWVVVIGGIAQNISSYTADQAVVQRYMTTPSQALAARSIWTNAVMVIPTTLIFFGIGTALYAFYRSHPDKLDPTITTDQIFPLFIAREMPVGLAGLIVAGIFAAAQSTVSTSMNSTATAIVTDFLRPWSVCRNESGYLAAARGLTFTFGVAGTLLGLLFVNPEIKSLFDAFIKVIGLFMGVLGGLFVLGAMTRRANGFGALTGALCGTAVMFSLWRYTAVTGYLYTFSGIVSCCLIGYLASLLTAPPVKDLTGLTLFTLQKPTTEAG